MYLFQFLSTVHAKVANSNPTNYIFLRLAIITLSIEHIKKPVFPKFKIELECLPQVTYQAKQTSHECSSTRLDDLLG